MLAAAIFLCSGIYIWNNFNVFSICSVLFAAALYCGWCIYKKRFQPIAICVIFLALGFIIINFSNSVSLQKAKPFDGTETRVYGKVFKTEKTDYGTKFYVKHRYKDGEKSKSIKICAYLNDENYIIRYGDIISFSARLKISDSGSGNGGYNKRMSLRSDGILLETSGKIKNVCVTETDIKFYNIFDLSYLAGEAVCNRVDSLFKGDSAGVIKGIIAGNGEEISAETEEYFRKSGISHILVVSGMHINIIVIISMYILLALKVGKGKTGMIIQLVLVWFFVFMTGFGLSGIRAAIVITLLYLSHFLSRDADSLNSLGFAALIILVLNPAAYFSAGFRLSFLSTGAILIFAKDIRRNISVLPGAIGESVAVTLSAQIGTLPVISQSFGTVGVFTVLANVIICPVLIILMAIIIIALIIGSVPFIGAGAVWVADIAVLGIIKTAEIIAKLPFSTIDVFSISGSAALVYVIFGASLKMFLIKSRETAKRLCMLALVMLCILCGYNAFENDAHITFLDIGSSDCTILKSGKMTIMFDGGGSDNYSVADSEVIPYLRKEAIGKIDAAFITHYHTDHAKGIAELIERGRIKRVILPAGVYKKDFSIFNAAKKADIPLHYIGNNDKIKIGDVLVEAYNTFGGSEENNGFVYFADCKGVRICISGDVTKGGEKTLLDRNINLKADILKIPHHGSKTSGSEEFLRAVSPEYGVILRGDNEFPDENSRALYEKLGINYFSTNDKGDIRFYITNSGKIKTNFGRNSFYELRNTKKAG